MIYAKLERRDNYAVVTNIITTDKTLSPPRYVDITNVTPQPQAGWFYRNGNFSAQPTNAIIRNALNAVVTALEDAGLVTRNF